MNELFRTRGAPGQRHFPSLSGIANTGLLYASPTGLDTATAIQYTQSPQQTPSTGGRRGRGIRRTGIRGGRSMRMGLLPQPEPRVAMKGGFFGIIKNLLGFGKNGKKRK